MRRILLVSAAITFAIACTDNITEPVPERTAAAPGAAVPVSTPVAFATTTTEDGLSISTDKDDYQPGDVVHLTGYGWQAGDVLDIVLTDDPLTHDPHVWTVDVGADGVFHDQTYVVDEGDLNVAFTLVATSRATGRSLRVNFTDSQPQAVTVTAITGTVTQGGSASYTVGVRMVGNSDQCTVTLSVSTVLPTGATAAFSGGANPFTAINLDFSRTLTISTTGATPANTHPFTVQAARGSDCQGSGVQTATGSLVVQAPANALTTTSVISSQNPSAFGDAVTFTATASSGSPAIPVTGGQISFKTGGTSCSDAAQLQAAQTVDASGQVTFTTSTLAIGPHTIRGCYGGATGFLPSEGSVAQQVNNTATEIDLISSVNPSVTGQSSTFTATITNNSNPVTVGQLSFKSGGASCSDATQVQAPQTPNGSGQVTYAAAFAAAASPVTIRACYGGATTPTLAPSEAALVQNINKATTTTAVASSLNPSVFTQTLTFTATVSVVSPGTGTPAGAVIFKDGTCAAGTTLAGPTTLDGSGQASFSTSSLTAGPHNITGCYQGDDDFDVSNGFVAQTVNKAETSTDLASSANPSVFSQTVIFTATVTVKAPASGVPAGDVTLKNGSCAAGAPLGGPSPLDGSGKAAFNISTLSVGPHTINACYSGNTNFEGSADDLEQTVNKASTTTVIISDANPSVFSQTVNFTATVTPSSPATETPTGSLSFEQGGTACGSGTTVLASAVALASGQATFSTSALAAGSQVIRACYAETANFLGSGNSVTQTVNKAATTTAITTSGTPSVLHQPVTFTATVTAEGPATATPNGTVKFYQGAACSGTQIGSEKTLSGGSATSDPTTSLSAGNNTVTACYAGNTNFESSLKSLTQQVMYRFEGLYAPVDRPNTMNLSKAGQAVPLKWRLTDFNDAPVLNFTAAALGVAVSGMVCAVNASLDQIEEYAGASGLQNLGDGYYQFNWKTPTSYANSCKAIGLNLGEGTPRGPLAFFNFKK